MSLIDLFALAGVRKDGLLDQWEFLFSPTKSSSVVSKDSGKPQQDRNIEPLNLSEQYDDKADKPQLKSKRKRNKSKKSIDDSSGIIKVGIDDGNKNDKRSITWGNVVEILCERTMSYSAVPNKGAYPLGLGEEIERETLTVDQLFMRQQLQLLERAKSIGIPVPVPRHTAVSKKDLKAIVEATIAPPLKSIPSPAVTASKGKKGKHNKATETTKMASDIIAADSVELAVPAYMSPLFETRQFDYKSSSLTNMIFRPSSEDERINMLTVNKIVWNKLADSSRETMEATASGPEADNAHHLLYPSMSIADSLNKEIKNIRASRSESTGCSCKHTKLDKLSVTKMRAELRSRGHLIAYTGDEKDISAMNKADLTEKVRAVLKQCQLCVDNNCECVQMGIACSALVCGCLRGGAAHHLRSPAGQVGGHSAAKSCENPEGFDMFDAETVKQYRQRVLATANQELFAVEAACTEEAIIQ